MLLKTDDDFFLFIVNQYHILLNGFFFFAFRLPLAPVPYLVYLLAGKKKTVVRYFSV